MRRFKAPQLSEQGPITLGEDSSHHLLRVVRIRLGERVELFDGLGHVAVAELVADTDGLARLALCEAPRLAAPPHQRHLLVGVPKGSAMDLAVRQATEAGVTHIHPLLLARCVAKGDRAERWRRIATSAAQQCGRGDIPEILPLAKLEEADGRLGPAARLVAHPGGGPLASIEGPAALLIGPEGGLTSDELRRAQKLGYERISLGAFVFRSETACAVGIASLG